jgi:hypothetical protein
MPAKVACRPACWCLLPSSTRKQVDKKQVLLAQTYQVDKKQVLLAQTYQNATASSRKILPLTAAARSSVHSITTWYRTAAVSSAPGDEHRRRSRKGPSCGPNSVASTEPAACSFPFLLRSQLQAEGGARPSEEEAPPPPFMPGLA